MPPVLPKILKAANLQWAISITDVSANFAALDRLLDKAIVGGAHIAALSELWTHSFCGPLLLEEAAALPERLEAIRARARKTGLWIAAGTIPERGSSVGKVFNSFHLFDPTGEIKLRYQKLHLFPNTGEPVFFDPGTEIPEPFESGGWKIGVGICYDLRFPELFRLQMKKGANLFFVPAQFPDPRVEHFKLFSRIRALENLAYLVSTNRIGTEELVGNADTSTSCASLSFSGKSSIIDPLGTPLSELGSSEECGIAELRLERLDEIRNSFPFLGVTPILDRFTSFR